MEANDILKFSGSLPAIFITESAMDHAAKQLNMDPDDFRRKNLYQQGQVNNYCVRVDDLTACPHYSFLS